MPNFTFFASQNLPGTANLEFDTFAFAFVAQGAVVSASSATVVIGFGLNQSVTIAGQMWSQVETIAMFGAASVVSITSTGSVLNNAAHNFEAITLGQGASLNNAGEVVGAAGV